MRKIIRGSKLNIKAALTLWYIIFLAWFQKSDIMEIRNEVGTKYAEDNCL